MDGSEAAEKFVENLSDDSNRHLKDAMASLQNALGETEQAIAQQMQIAQAQIGEILGCSTSPMIRVVVDGSRYFVTGTEPSELS